MNYEQIRLLRLTVLGSIAVLPLLILPTMVGALVDYGGFGESQAGWVAALGSLGSAVTAIFLGFRIRHVNPRKIAIAGLITLAVADSLSTALGQLPIWLFLSFRVVSGVGAAAVYAAVMATIAASRNPERGYGAFMVLQFSLSAVGLYGLPFLLPDIGAVGIYVISASAALTALFLVSAVVDREPVTGDGVAGLEIKALLKTASLLAMFGIGLFETSNNMHFAYADRIGLSYGLTDLQIGEILGIATVFGIPAAFGVAWIGDRYGDLLPLLASLALAILALLALNIFGGQMVYVFAMCSLSIAWAFGLPYFQAIEARLDPGGSVVVAGGFFTSIGAALGPALGAILVAGPGYSGILLVAAAIYVVVAGLMMACLRFVRD